MIRRFSRSNCFSAWVDPRIWWGLQAHRLNHSQFSDIYIPPLLLEQWKTSKNDRFLSFFGVDVFEDVWSLNWQQRLECHRRRWFFENQFQKRVVLFLFALICIKRRGFLHSKGEGKMNWKTGRKGGKGETFFRKDMLTSWMRKWKENMLNLPNLA